MADLHAAAKAVLSEKGYSGEVYSDLRAAIEVRLGMLTRLAIGCTFRCRESVPAIDELLSGHTILELACLPREQGCLLTLFLLTLIRERLRTLPWKGDGIRLAIVLEEAHNIAKQTREAVVSEENADPGPFAAEFICRMLAELRALGVATVVVDQLPSAVATEVIKNTGSKLAFRQVAMDDREGLGATMLFGPLEMEDIAGWRADWLPSFETRTGRW